MEALSEDVGGRKELTELAELEVPETYPLRGGKRGSESSGTTPKLLRGRLGDAAELQLV